MTEEVKADEDAADDHDPFLRAVGARIRAARKQAKLRQVDLAKALNTRQSYIGAVELGMTNTSLKSIARIAAALGVSPVTFLEDHDSLLNGLLHQLAQVIAALQQADQARGDLGKTAAGLVEQAQALVSAKPGVDGPDLRGDEKTRL